MPVVVICDENGNFVIQSSPLKGIELARSILNGTWQQPEHLHIDPPYHIIQRGDLIFLTNPNQEQRPSRPDLAPQEVQVLCCLGSGLSIEATAKKLHISVRTVRAYLEKLKEKLNAQSRDQLMAMAGYLGYLDTADFN
jgi:DNA-binding CsgD family transcriptional regulator